MDKSLMSKKAESIFDSMTSGYLSMYYAGLRDGFENVLNILKETKDKGEEVSIDDLIANLGKVVRTYDGELIDDDKELEDRETAPEEFKEKGMSDEAFRSLMNFKKIEKAEEEKEESSTPDNVIDINEIKEKKNEESSNEEMDPELYALLHEDESIVEEGEVKEAPSMNPMMGGMMGMGGLGALAGMMGGDMNPPEESTEESKEEKEESSEKE